MLKNIIKIIGKYYLHILIYILVITTISYLNILSYKTISILNYIYLLLISLISGIKIARLSNKKGYLYGSLIGIIFSITLILLSLLLNNKLSLKSLIYYTTLILTSSFGGIIGINTKKQG